MKHAIFLLVATLAFQAIANERSPLVVKTILPMSWKVVHVQAGQLCPSGTHFYAYTDYDLKLQICVKDNP